MQWKNKEGRWNHRVEFSLFWRLFCCFTKQTKKKREWSYYTNKLSLSETGSKLLCTLEASQEKYNDLSLSQWIKKNFPIFESTWNYKPLTEIWLQRNSGNLAKVSRLSFDRDALRAFVFVFILSRKEVFAKSEKCQAFGGLKFNLLVEINMKCLLQSHLGL